MRHIKMEAIMIHSYIAKVFVLVAVAAFVLGYIPPLLYSYEMINLRLTKVVILRGRCARWKEER